MVTCLATWPTGPVQLEWIAGALADTPVTGAHGFCFSGDQVLVCDVVGRGPSIPGGHLEAGESPLACLEREALEEAAAELEDVVLLGHIVTDHSVNASYRGRYPHRAGQAMFVATIKRLSSFKASHDSTERRLVSCDKLSAVHHEWNDVLAAAYAAALATRPEGVQPTRTYARERDV
jgi:8-oxo-dGTP diphosphatase